MGFFGGFEWLIIILILILLFGAKKIPEVARGIGRGIVEFRKSSKEEDKGELPEEEDNEPGHTDHKQ